MKLGTHHGRFHADDVFAIAILKQLYPSASVVRSRDRQILSECDIVVDVGGGLYDHHTTDKVYRDNGIPYASAGLIWRDYGPKLVETQCKPLMCDSVWRAVDEKLMQGIDAVDNGFELAKDVRIKGVSEIISSFNPPWNSDSNEDTAFLEAVDFATTVLFNQLRVEISRQEAVEIVETAFQNRANKALLILPQFCPWMDALISLDTKEEVLFTVFPDRGGEYRIQTVPAAIGTFESRKPLPLSWAGKEHEELSAIVGVEDAVFCHPSRFIAGAKSKDSIMKMAKIALA